MDPRDAVKVALVLTGLMLAPLSACWNTPTMSPTPISPPRDWGTSVALTERVAELTIQPLIATESARLASYELEPGETVVPLAVPGDMEYGSIMIGFSGTRLEEESGQTQRWVAFLWLGSEQHPSALPMPVHEGDIIEFEGYRIRILGIETGGVDFAIGESGRPPSQATATLSIYNTEPGESLHLDHIGNNQRYESIWYVANDLRTEEIVDESGAVTERKVVSIRVWSDQSSAEVSDTMGVGDVIEFEGYRIRLLSIHEETYWVAVGKLSESPAILETEAP
jgi:hypothetical protein